MSIRYLTIVYKYISPERTAELTQQHDVSAMAHSHKMDEAKRLKEALEQIEQICKEEDGIRNSIVREYEIRTIASSALGH